jgi:hypothetical protein
MNPYDILHKKGHEGKFSSQFKARRPQHRHIKDLASFAHYILQNPHEFNKISHQRANYYVNLIEKKGGSCCLDGVTIKRLHKCNRLCGGKLSVREFEKMIKESYRSESDRDRHIGDYVLDPDLSTYETAVYHNPKTGETKVAYKGTANTLRDWGNNALYALGLHNKSGRYDRAKKVQEAVEKKYGTENLDVLGHSQSGAFTQDIGKNAKNVIALNPATHPLHSNEGKNATILKSKGDIVSKLNYLNPFAKKQPHISIPSNYNPVESHLPSVLQNIDPDMILGNGRKKRKPHKKLQVLFE